MSRFYAFLLLFLLVLAGVGFLALGLFPPTPAPRQVETVLPNNSLSVQ